MAGYGWLGGKERATPTGTFGLTLMGARLYNPVTGRFTTTDPVYGGNANTYTYPTDPINTSDLTGLA
ncbi:RHS repeat-associated core domain-containing protein [Kytococcus sedentarius]|uniref:RHS repeat-associated core domain-containing protein n=1 Tax=Kytococcus sedentarius TaxID=1276 RepID=UPI00384E5A2C